MCRRLGAVLALAGICCACGSPSSSTNQAVGQTISGRASLYWNQAAPSDAEMASIRYAIYIDGVRSELSGVQCAATASPVVYDCRSPLPPLTVGPHRIQLASYYSGFEQLEGLSSAISVFYGG